MLVFFGGQLLDTLDVEARHLRALKLVLRDALACLEAHEEACLARVARGAEEDAGDAAVGPCVVCGVGGGVCGARCARGHGCYRVGTHHPHHKHTYTYVNMCLHMNI